MGGNKYVSVILNALVEIPANLVIMVVMNFPRYDLATVYNVLMCSIFSVLQCVTHIGACWSVATMGKKPLICIFVCACVYYLTW